MKKPTLQQFQAFAKANKPLALKVAGYQVAAELMRAKVDAYIKPVFDSFGLVYGSMIPEMAGKPVESPKDAYLVEDEAKIAEYYKACDVAHRANGFTGPEGYCPALMAENMLMEAQRELIAAGADFMGIDMALLYGKEWDYMLKLLMGACMVGERKAA